MPRKTRRGPEEIRQIVQDFHESGLSVEDFARRMGLQRLRLIDWIRRESHAVRSSKNLVQVDVRKPSAVESHIEILMEGGLALRVPSGFDSESLLRLLDVLEKRC